MEYYSKYLLNVQIYLTAISSIAIFKEFSSAFTEQLRQSNACGVRTTPPHRYHIHVVSVCDAYCTIVLKIMNKNHCFHIFGEQYLS